MKKALLIICLIIVAISLKELNDFSSGTSKLSNMGDAQKPAKDPVIDSSIKKELPVKTSKNYRKLSSLDFSNRAKTLEIYHNAKDLPHSINLLKNKDYNPLKDKKEDHKVTLPHINDPRYSIGLHVKETLVQGKNPLISIKVSFSLEGNKVFFPYTMIIKKMGSKLNDNIIEKENLKKSSLSLKLNSKLEAGDYLIQVHASPPHLSSSVPLIASSSFRVSPRFTQYLKHSKDELDGNGNLHYKALYKVMTKGHYIFEAVINDKNGNPLALVENVVKLKTGNFWVDLPVHGYLFHKKNISGSFTITHQRLRKMKKNFSLWSNKVEKLNYTTNSYSLEEFNSSPHQNKVLFDKIKKLSKAN